MPESLLNHIGPFLMVLFRLLGLFIFAPILSSTSIPARIRVLLALALAVAMYPTIPASQMAPIQLDLFTLGPAIFAETLIGVVLGLIASLPMFAVQLAGMIMGQQTGLTLGGVFNPALEIETDAISQLLMYIAIAAFVALGGLEVLFLAVARSFAHIPLASVAIMVAPLDLIVGLISSGFELALRVAAPVLCILLVETVASSFLMRSLPQINILSIGYGLKILLGLIVFAAAVGTMEPAIERDIADALGSALRWVDSLVQPALPEMH